MGERERVKQKEIRRERRGGGGVGKAIKKGNLTNEKDMKDRQTHTQRRGRGKTDRQTDRDGDADR